jgi:hypothetical protein
MHMAEILRFPSEKERLYRSLSLAERQFAEYLLQVAPDYSYAASGLPKLNPAPAAGLASAVAAAKMMSAFGKVACES